MNPSHLSSDDEALPPEQMLALLEDQQRKVDADLLRPIPWLYAIWGVAWLVGFLLLWSAWDGGNPWFRVPGIFAGITFALLTIGAVVASAVMGVRINKGVRGASDFQGMVYGLSWSFTGAAFALVGMGLISNGMSTELASIYFPSAYALMVGTLYLGGAALWRDKGQLVLGLVQLAVASVAPLAGQPNNNLVMALAGGGAFLVAALVVGLRLRANR